MFSKACLLRVVKKLGLTGKMLSHLRVYQFCDNLLIMKKSITEKDRYTFYRESDRVYSFLEHCCAEKIVGWVQYYPQCLYCVKAIWIALHSPIEILYSFGDKLRTKFKYDKK